MKSEKAEALIINMGRMNRRIHGIRLVRQASIDGSEIKKNPIIAWKGGDRKWTVQT